jgi:cation diffusion facilitator family transporter
MSTSIDRSLGPIPTADIEAGVPLDEDRQLYRLLLWSYFTRFPFVAMFIVIAALADSTAVLVHTASSLIAMVVQTFSIVAIRQVIGHNTFRFPYGAGKLEDFSAFLCGFLFVPIGTYLAYDSLWALMHPHHVGYALGLIPIAVSLGRRSWLYEWARRLARRAEVPSPLLHAFIVDYRIGVLNDLGVILAFAVGWSLVRLGVPALGNRVDPLVALVISLYMAWEGVKLVRHNFRSLMDLPLPEDAQLRIMKALARHSAQYETIGTVYSRSSGKQRFVEIELGFDGRSSLEEIDALSRSMEEGLAEEIPGLVFRIIPTAAS